MITKKILKKRLDSRGHPIDEVVISEMYHSNDIKSVVDNLLYRIQGGRPSEQESKNEVLIALKKYKRTAPESEEYRLERIIERIESHTWRPDEPGKYKLPFLEPDNNSHPFKDEKTLKLFEHLLSQLGRKKKVAYTHVYNYLKESGVDAELMPKEYFTYVEKRVFKEKISHKPQPNAATQRVMHKLRSAHDSFLKKDVNQKEERN
jgi:hypothetical protein